MTESATRRKSATSDRITLCAQKLTDEHGLDGFTMDDLAAAADVSRRTLFNYFTGKVDAVLGHWPTIEDELSDRFVHGGPDRDLVQDLRTLVIGMLDAEVVERPQLERSRRILQSTPRLMGAVHARYQEVSADIVKLIEAREGAEFGAARARVAVDLLAALLGSSLDQFLIDPDERPIAVIFDDSLATARSLLGA